MHQQVLSERPSRRRWWWPRRSRRWRWPLGWRRSALHRTSRRLVGSVAVPVELLRRSDLHRRRGPDVHLVGLPGRADAGTHNDRTATARAELGTSAGERILQRRALSVLCRERCGDRATVCCAVSCARRLLMATQTVNVDGPLPPPANTVPVADGAGNYNSEPYAAAAGANSNVFTYDQGSPDNPAENFYGNWANLIAA